ncbi:MAG: type II secretion system F family protein [Patescibacteria group bacterium]|nr:type II secretion system F family protein [Patescibacteria group bacterium]
MSIFNYRASNQFNQIFQGAVEAPSIELAESALKDKGLRIIDIQEETTNIIQGIKIFNIFSNVSKKDLVIFSRQLSVMVSATVPIIQSLRSIAQQSKNQKLKDIINLIADDVDGGLKLSEAMKKHKTFDNFFVNMVASGETSGKLDEVLNYLADEVEKSYDLQAKIKGAMMYPIFIVGGLFLVGIAMMVFVIPNLTGMLEASGQELPLPTKILIRASDVFRFHWIYVLIGFIVLVGGGFYFFKKTEMGKTLLGNLKLKFPVFGKLFQNIYLVRFAGTLSSLLNAGVTLTESLRITAGVVSNKRYKDLLERTMKKVEDGYSLADELSKSNLFPPMVSQMLKIGEKTGRMNFVLDKLSSFYSREVSNMVGNLTSLLEPIIMVAIGIGVGGMVAAVIMPMYNMANTF